MSPAAFLQKPVRWLRAVSTYRARTTGAPNFAFDLTARAVTPEQKATLDLSCLDLIYNGSEPIDARALDRFAEAFAPCGFRREALYPCYGMAETTLLSTGSRPRQGARVRSVDAGALTQRLVRVVEPGAAGSQALVGCGYSVNRQDLEIVEPETRRRVTDDAVGEIWLRGPHVARGYWRQPDLTRETFGARARRRRRPVPAHRRSRLRSRRRAVRHRPAQGRDHHPRPELLPAGHRARGVGQPRRRCVAGSVAAFGVRRPAARSGWWSCRSPARTAMRDLDADAVMAAMRKAVAEQFDLTLSAIVLVKPLNVPKTSSGKIRRRACRERWQRRGSRSSSRRGAPRAAAPEPAARPAGGRRPLSTPTRSPAWMRRAVAQANRHVRPPPSMRGRRFRATASTRCRSSASVECSADGWRATCRRPCSSTTRRSRVSPPTWRGRDRAGAAHARSHPMSRSRSSASAAAFPAASRRRRLLASADDGVDAISEVPADRWDAVVTPPDAAATLRRLPRRGRSLRSAVLRHLAARSRGDGPAAAAAARGGLGSAGARGHRAGAPRRIGDRRLRRRQHARLRPAAAAVDGRPSRHVQRHRQRAQRGQPAGCPISSASTGRAWRSTPPARRRWSRCTRVPEPARAASATPRWPAAST